MLGDFAADHVLPHRLGDLRETRFSLVKINDSTWFVADHAFEVTDVQIDDASVQSWEQTTDSDDTGNLWTLVLLGAPAPPDAKVTASGVGRLNPATGALIENPAEIMEYVLRLAGRSERFPLLRAECAAAGYTAAGSLDELKSIRAWLDEIAYSFGAIWTPGNARLYPTRTIRGPVIPFDQTNAAGLSTSASLEDACDELRVSYNVDQSTGNARRYVQLSASPPRFGGVSREVTLKWARKPTDAEKIGRRMLERMGGRTYTTTLRTSDTSARPCDWRQFVSHREWPTSDADPVGMILAIDCEPGKRTSFVTLEVIADAPSVDVTGSSIAVPIEVGAAVDVEIADGEVTFRITDDDGKTPIVDAFVSLDGGTAKKTNAQGKVTFGVTPSDPPKKHELAVEAPGKTPFILDVFL